VKVGVQRRNKSRYSCITCCSVAKEMVPVRTKNTLMHLHYMLQLCMEGVV